MDKIQDLESALQEKEKEIESLKEQILIQKAIAQFKIENLENNILKDIKMAHFDSPMGYTMVLVFKLNNEEIKIVHQDYLAPTMKSIVIDSFRDKFREKVLEKLDEVLKLERHG